MTSFCESGPIHRLDGLNARLSGSEPRPDAAKPPFFGTKNTSGYPSQTAICLLDPKFAIIFRIQTIFYRIMGLNDRKFD